MRNQRNDLIETAEEVRGTIAETAQAINDTAADLGTKATAEEVRGTVAERAQAIKDTAADLGTKATQYAAEASRQAARAAYGTGNEMRDRVERFSRENTWASLLIASAVGFSVAYLVKSRRR